MKKFLKKAGHLFDVAYKTAAASAVTLGATTPVFAADSSLPTGNGITDWIKTIAGNLVIIYLIVQIFKGIFTQRWGMVIGSLLGAALLIWIINFTDSFIGALKALVQLFQG